MSLRLRFAMLSLCSLSFGGCVAPQMTVATADWEAVPQAQRAAVDRQGDAELAAARTEIAAASKSLAELQRAPAPAATTAAPALAIRADDPQASALRDHERSRRTAHTRVETARTAWLRADLQWRQLRLEAANARIDVVTARRELSRGQTIDRNLLGSDTYDTAPLRGQLSQAQQRWYAIDTKARRARADLDRASAELASSKEAYAQIMRRIPGATTGVVAELEASDDRAVPMVLPTWAVSRADIRRRRGLRHFLDEIATAPPRLKPTTIKLSPTPPRPAAAPASAMNEVAAPASPAQPAVALTPVAGKAAPVPTAVAAQPASVAAVATKPAPAKAPSPPGPKAWDTDELSSGPPIVGTQTRRGAAVASSTPVSKAGGAKPAPAPGIAKPAPAPTPAANSKPAVAPAAPAPKAAPTPAKPATATNAPTPAPSAKPVETTAAR